MISAAQHLHIQDPHGVLTHQSGPDGWARHRIIGPVSAHRHHRGPYTFAGDLVRRLVPGLLLTDADLVEAHDVEVRVVAPELRGMVAATRETLTSSATPEERTRFYPGAYTRRIAHGLVDMLLDLVHRYGPLSLMVTDVDEADPTDVELLEVLWRRAPADHLQLLLATSTGSLPGRLGAHAATDLYHPDLSDTDQDQWIDGDPAVWYVASNCTSRLPRAKEGYDALPDPRRRRLHDEHADRLESSGEGSWRLGAIPLHRELGSDPVRATRVLLDALEDCVMMGFYDAAVELGQRAAGRLDWRADPATAWTVTAKVATAMTALGRPDEAAEAYDAACAASSLPSVHLQSAYGRAMLYTRFYDGDRKDHRKARAAINTAIAISSLLPEDEQRLFNLTFNENGLALIAMHLGDPLEALSLIEDGLRRLDSQLGPEAQTLHRSVLRYNRAQLLARVGRLDDAVAAYDQAIAADPNHSEYHLERADLHRRLGHVEQALTDLTAAVATSPPYPEPHFNRGDLLFELGRTEEAAVDFARAADLDPDLVDARLNLASALLELGRVDDALQALADAPASTSAHVDFQVARSTVLLAGGDVVKAEEAALAAVALDPGAAGAFAQLGAIAFERGDLVEAEQQLAVAAALGDDPAVHENLEVIRSVLGQGTQTVGPEGHARYPGDSSTKSPLDHVTDGPRSLETAS